MVSICFHVVALYHKAICKCTYSCSLGCMRPAKKPVHNSWFAKEIRLLKFCVLLFRKQTWSDSRNAQSVR